MKLISAMKSEGIVTSEQFMEVRKDYIRNKKNLKMKQSCLAAYIS